MGFVPAKCTQCGADINVDDSRDAGICEYCGTAFVTEKAINNYNTNDHDGAGSSDSGSKIENYLDIADNALDANNGREAYRYANKALETDASCSRAWMIKMEATALITDRVNDPAEEITTYGMNAISFAAEEELSYVTVNVYSCFLTTALNFLNEATERILDTDTILAARFTGVYDPIKLLTDDSKVREEIDKLVENAWVLKNSVPEDVIKESPSHRNTVKYLVSGYQRYCQYDAFRVSLYDGAIYDFEQKSRERVLALLKKGLTDEDIRELEEEARAAEPVATNDPPPPKKGCYIATAVYGSYDCTEVMVLRRFRDDVLSQYRCGRCFIHVYYATSPLLVKYLGQNKIALRMGRLVLDRIVRRIRGYNENVPVDG